jgi:8-oxo-dGTP diphosphatase
MQRVANCILRDRNRVLLLQKPRRGWWTAPGGKVEPGETLMETVQREFVEETGLTLIQPRLRGIFTMCIRDGDQLVQEWMMFTFFAEHYTGSLLQHTEEGILRWHSVDTINQLPTAPGDRFVFDRIASGRDLLIGRFTYTPSEELIDYTFHTGTENVLA